MASGEGRTRSNSYKRNASDDWETAPGTTGLTPKLSSINGLGVDASRKTPKLGAKTSPAGSTPSPFSKSPGVGDLPSVLELPNSPGKQTNNTSVARPLDLLEADQMSTDDADIEEEESTDDSSDGLEAMLAFHQNHSPKKGKPVSQKTSKPEATPAPAPLVEDRTPEPTEDGWATVKSDKKSSGKKKDLSLPDDAYVDHNWSSDDGDWATDRDMSKSGAGSAGKGKHGHGFKVTQARNMQIAKRDAQRGHAAR